MKRVILDAPFEGDIPVLLTKGEKVLWKEEPNHKLGIFNTGSYTRYLKTFVMLLFGGIWVLMFTSVIVIGFISAINKELANYSGWFILLLALGGLIKITFLTKKEYTTYKKRSKTKYILTNKKLVFKLEWKKKQYIYVQPLEEIKYIQEAIIGLTGVSGNIFLTVKNPPTDIEYYDFVFDKENNKITLEGLEHVLKVTTILTRAIEENNKR